MRKKSNYRGDGPIDRPHRHSGDRDKQYAQSPNYSLYVDDGDPTRRSASARCARCKKIRKMWMNDNERCGKQRVSSINIAGEGKVCWICRVREADPDWRPGLPLPEHFDDKPGGIQ